MIRTDLSDSRSYSAFMSSARPSTKQSTYFDVYDHLFEKYRGLPIVFVEVGVLGGGSLHMWREFFGPQARIIGIDVSEEAKALERDGFEIFVGSQNDHEFWQSFIDNVGHVDILLDDGGHTYEQQIVTTEMMIENICDGGLLVVEDTHTSYQKGFGARRYSFVNYVKHLFDLVNYRFWDLESSKKDLRIWSIEVFDSIVAFRVNKNGTSRVSAEINNGKEFSGAAFRYANQGKSVINRRRNVLRKFPGSKATVRYLRRLKIRLSTLISLRRYFR